MFDDPSIDFYSEAQTIFDDYTDANGNAQVNANLEVNSEAPGTLNAVFRGKVYEESGQHSIDRFSIPFYPYETLVGIKLPRVTKPAACYAPMPPNG